MSTWEEENEEKMMNRLRSMLRTHCLDKMSDNPRAYSLIYNSLALLTNEDPTGHHRFIQVRVNKLIIDGDIKQCEDVGLALDEMGQFLMGICNLWQRETVKELANSTAAASA
jgi:hypothetical protein